jgi:phosphoribosylaminoimidazole-succinocarboxamide synthase
MSTTVTEVNLHTLCPDVELISKGKVREIYRLKQEPSQLLLVATDRLSAFDVIMKTGIPDKGKLLTQLSDFWFHHVLQNSMVPHHLITSVVTEMPLYLHQYPILYGRSMLVRSLTMLPVEAVVRGYLTGSAWKEYCQSQTIHKQKFPVGLMESAQLSFPLYTPTTKAPLGQHGKLHYSNELTHNMIIIPLFR